MNRKSLMLMVVVAVLVIGGGVAAYAYETLIGFGSPDDTPPEAPTLEAAAPQQTVYRIDPSQSSVTYTVQELFLRDNARNTAVGMTQGIAGDVLIDFDQPAQSQIGTVVINIEQFTSDSSLRDGRIRQDYLESSDYPEAVFVPRELIGFPENPEIGGTYSFQVTGDLTIKNTTQSITWEVTASLTEENQLVGSASTMILMSDYEVGPISIAGLVETEDEVRLQFDFVALPQPSTALE